MDDWKSLLYQIANKSETSFDRFKLRFRERMGWNTDIQIVPFMTFGTINELHIKGRVLHDKRMNLSDRDNVWVNLLNMYKRFSSNEIAGAKLEISFNQNITSITSDEDGYFETYMTFQNPLPAEELWHHPLIELKESPIKNLSLTKTRARVLTPGISAQFGVISDIDDTIIPTHAHSLLKSAYTTFLNNAHTRLPFEGVAAFYKALQNGYSGNDYNPVFYVSSSPWNLYDLLTDFMSVNGIPQGPLLLKDYGFTHNKIFSESHSKHKLTSINKILSVYPSLPFILIGDSGQHDPEIYADVVKENPGRIKAIYIRDVSKEERDMEIKVVSESLTEHKVEMILIENSYTAAQHASSNGFINPGMLPFIREEKDLDHEGEDLT